MEIYSETIVENNITVIPVDKNQDQKVSSLCWKYPWFPMSMSDVAMKSQQNFPKRAYELSPNDRITHMNPQNYRISQSLNDFGRLNTFRGVWICNMDFQQQHTQKNTPKFLD